MQKKGYEFYHLRFFRMVKIFVENMPENYVIFNEGIEKDYVKFLSGTIAKIMVADKEVNLVNKEE